MLTCEHGGNKIPEEYKWKFENAEEILNSHRGFDPGALDLLMHLRSLSNSHYFTRTSRLLVELNRSLHHPDLFSEFTKDLSTSKKEEILSEYYWPYRNEVEKNIRNWVEAGEQVLHISVHTFTPVLKETIRNTEIGLLYDPARQKEKLLAKRWREYLKTNAPHHRVRFNYPYKGTADGFTTYLRKRFPENYMGIEIEINQRFSRDNLMDLNLKIDIYNSLQQEIKRRQKE